MLKSPDKIYVSYSKVSGRGVFAKEDIQPGEILEESHFIELNEKDFNNIDDVLKEYVFTFPIGNKNNCVVLGFGMIYNHSLIPNAYWECDEEMKLFRFISNRLIKKDEEIFTNYQKWVDF
jgi:SET domain-containing protein